MLQALEQAFAIADPPKPWDLLGLLELFEALALDSGATLTDESARASVSRIAGTSKTAKTAARILAVGGPMTTTTDELVYRYVGASSLRDDGGRLELDLATSGGCAPNPSLAEASSARPGTVARALLLVANVAGARFWTPPNMVAAAIEAADLSSPHPGWR